MRAPTDREHGQFCDLSPRPWEGCGRQAAWRGSNRWEGRVNQCHSNQVSRQTRTGGPRGAHGSGWHASLPASRQWPLGSDRFPRPISLRSWAGRRRSESTCREISAPGRETRSAFRPSHSRPNRRTRRVTSWAAEPVRGVVAAESGVARRGCGAPITPGFSSPSERIFSGGTEHATREALAPMAPTGQGSSTDHNPTINRGGSMRPLFALAASYLPGSVQTGENAAGSWSMQSTALESSTSAGPSCGNLPSRSPNRLAASEKLPASKARRAVS